MLMDTKEFYAAVGLNTVGQSIEEQGKAAILKLKKKLFRQGNDLGREEGELTSDSDGDDDSASKGPESPAGQKFE